MKRMVCKTCQETKTGSNNEGYLISHSHWTFTYAPINPRHHTMVHDHRVAMAVHGASLFSLVGVLATINHSRLGTRDVVVEIQRRILKHVSASCATPTVPGTRFTTPKGSWSSAGRAVAPGCSFTAPSGAQSTSTFSSPLVAFGGSSYWPFSWQF